MPDHRRHTVKGDCGGHPKTGAASTEAAMRSLCGTILAGLALLVTANAGFAASPQPSPQFSSGLICDTREQAERFVLVLRDNVEKALGTVNTEAGTPDACIVATYGFVPGQTVSEVAHNGAIMKVIEVRVLAVATSAGVQMIEPKVFYSILPTGDRIA
jgi:hypothetical protein